MRKANSTNSENEQYLNVNCAISFTMSKIEGRWKVNILAYLFNHGKLRYSEIRLKLKGISERILTARLQELEKDGLVRRIVHATVPPKVEYELSDHAITLVPVLKLMDNWGERNMKN